MQTSVSNSLQSMPLVGGNGTLFSLLVSMMQMMDEHTLTMELFQQVVRNWGASYSSSFPKGRTLEEDLDAVSDVLRMLGLVRIFEPHPNSENTRQILVMRCLFSRYVSRIRIQKCLPSIRVLPLFVEGLLTALGHPYDILEKDAPNLRIDEYILVVVRKA